MFAIALDDKTCELPNLRGKDSKAHTSQNNSKLVSRVGWIRLSIKSIVRIAPPHSLGEEETSVFVCLVATEKHIARWTRLKAVKSYTFLFGRVIIDFFQVQLQEKIGVNVANK